MKEFDIRKTCRLCDGTRLTEVLRLPDTPLANEYPREPSPNQQRFPLFLVACHDCGHVQLPVVVRPDRLFPADYPYRSGTNPVFRQHLSELAEDVRRLGKGGPVLDIGCNDGTFVKMLGDQALGIDPCAPEGPQFTRGFWSSKEAREVRGALSVITALNVFAHVDDLNDFAAGVATALEPDGMFIFEVGYLPDVIERGLFDVIYHEHLSYHHLSPLVGFFKRHGMELVDAERIESQGGSVRGYVRNCGGHQARSARLDALLEGEVGPTVVPVPARVEVLSRCIQRTKQQIIEVFRQKRGGQKLAGYGAPAKLTTLLAACGLQAGNFEYVADDNPNKVGRYVPGTGVPIVSTSELETNPPDTVVIFSWNFASEIMSRYPDAPWRWVVPLPELQMWQKGERLPNPPGWQTLRVGVDRSGKPVVL